VAALERGESATTIARVLGVHVKSVYRWQRMAATPGGLDAIRHPGPTALLDDSQLQQLEALLLQGSKHHGWHNELWTAARVARLIKLHFGIDYHPEHVRKILHERLHWSSQKPRRKARERDDKEVERWKDDEFRRIVREAFARKAHLVFLDESGFQLNPSLRRTLAPRGKTPVLPAWDRRDRISAISCVTLSPVLARPGLYFELLPVNQTVHAEQVVEFLEALRRQLGGPFTVIWDRHKIHSKAKLVKAYLAEHPEVVAEDLPPYAPNENPDEWVWSWAKYGRLANLAAWDSQELYDHAFEALADLKFRPDLLDSFLLDADLPLAA
jgi:transposase